MSTGSFNSRPRAARRSFAVMAPQNDYGNVALGRIPGERADALNAPRRRRSPAMRPGRRGRGAADRRRRRPDRRAVHSRSGRRHARRRDRARLERRQDATPGHRRLERRPGAAAAAACRAPGSPRPTTPASTRSRSATRPSSTASRPGSRRSAYDAVTLAGALARRPGPLQPARADQCLRLQRRRRRVPLPRRRNQRAGPRGDGDRQQCRHRHQPGAAEFRGGVRDGLAGEIRPSKVDPPHDFAPVGSEELRPSRRIRRLKVRVAKGTRAETLVTTVRSAEVAPITAGDPVIGLKEATKAFGGTLALRNVSFDLAFRRGSRAAWREWRRQKHVRQDVCRRLSADAGPCGVGRSARRLRFSA